MQTKAFEATLELCLNEKKVHHQKVRYIMIKACEFFGIKIDVEAFVTLA